ncbi:hypothetical protein [Oceaniglobus roseus]|uniref:hypothetical protein n=1 Tax=Oceaniglobus roseus TaxID=1737570 RepID=UPI001FE29499|nr:hypothetical protein [Kandeliimicrobium roseum]
MLKPLLPVMLLLSPSLALAADNRLALSAPQALADSGFLQYLLPRFALKHGVRVEQTDAAPEAVLGGEGVPVFTGLGQTWRLEIGEAAEAEQFRDWLLSEIGQNTVASFEKDGETPFSPPVAEPEQAEAVTFDGDPVAGAKLAEAQCGRCHVVSEKNRMNGISATPSFAVLRALPEWENRFATFYVLNPHPSFTQIVDVTPPFHDQRPPGIVPLEMTLDDVEAIAAYAATLAPADLGAPIEAQ